LNIDHNELLQFNQYLALQDQVKSKKMKPAYFIYNSQAMELINSGGESSNLIKAEKLLLKALKLTTKNQYTQASACHELGVLYFSYHTRLPGGAYENLKKSVMYLTRAIETKERRKFPDKYASSLSQLGAAYRRAAMERLWPESSSKCLQKAENLHKNALNVLSDFKFSLERSRQTPIIYFNLASVLLDKQDTTNACDIQVKAFECFMNAHKLSIPNCMDPNQAFGLTFSRLNYFSEDKTHKDLCEYILKIAPDFGIDPLDLMLINPTRDIANPKVEILYLVDRASKANSDKDIEMLGNKISLLMKNRQHTKSDQESDAVTVLIQLASSGLARNLIKKGHYLDALVELENVSAMRFCENANKYWHLPEQKLALFLLRSQQHLGSTYYNLNELSLMLEQIDDKENVKRYLSDSVNALVAANKTANKLEDNILFDTHKYVEIVRESIRQKNPSCFLQNVANVCLDDYKKLERRIDKIDPDYAKRRISDSAITSKNIEFALQKHPNLTLLKIDIEDLYDDVVIIVASKQDGKIITSGFTFKLPDNLVNKIGSFINQENEDSDQWQLDFIDWKAILPPESRNIALLTSFFASQIPWNATGKSNEKLLDLVEEINWIPTIMYLCNKVSYFDKKKGTLALPGGGTQFNQLAYSNQGYLDDCLEKKDIIDSISQADVFSYYGHCEHKHPDRPSLLFQGVTIKDTELVDSVSGAERIEFWACQSGSNIPLHFLGCCVNEAFGMDMRMIEWGSKTSIGSLWAVPELVTAHIKNYYDKLISEGCNASQALLSAQRWWINKGADKELQKISEMGTHEYLSSLNSENIPTFDTFDSFMGPVLGGTVNKIDMKLEQIESSFKHPAAWAGMRFCGVSEQKHHYISRSSLAINDKDRNHLDRLIRDINLKSGFIKHGQ
jgi:hypothetical protein